MLSNPSTPPNASAGPIILTDDATTLSLGSSNSSQQHASPATLTGNIGSDGVGELDNRLDPSAPTEEDQDASDGGVSLTVSLSHTSDLYPDVEMLDVEALDEDDIGILPHTPAFPSSATDESFSLDLGYTSSFDQSGDGEDPEDEMSMVLEGPGVSPWQSPLMPLLVVDQPLNLEDLQPQVETEILEDNTHLESVQHNSTQPIPLPPSISEAINLLTASPAPAVFQTLAQTLSPTQVAPGVVQFSFSNPPHISSTSSQPPDASVTELHSLAAPGSVNPSLVILNQPLITPGLAQAIQRENRVNLDLGEFLFNWAVFPREGADPPKRHPGRPLLSAIHDLQPLNKLIRPVKQVDLCGNKCDFQGLDWMRLGVSRATARSMRLQTYKNYTTMMPTAAWHPRINGLSLCNKDNFFSFRRMDFGPKIQVTHFQLRNHLVCASLDRVFYNTRSLVRMWDAQTGPSLSRTVMDLTRPKHQTAHAFAGGVRISSLAASNDILAAGGFYGEYAFISLRSKKTAPVAEGLLSEAPNNITNHVQVNLNRHSGLPEAVFATNEGVVRILDCNTNKVVAKHVYNHAINCSAISPDKRLRVLIGDSRNVLICNAETGEILQNLEGHKDFGFACAWADDGWTVASGNQDMQVKIWDARKWTDRRGIATPIITIAAEMGGVRNLKFSPLGSGKRVLAAAEPADIVSVIDADTFSTKQTLDFFGEIAGMDFTADGGHLLVGNCDKLRGGIMQFQRCGWANEGLYEWKHIGGRAKSERGGYGLDWRRTAEEVVRDVKVVGTRVGRARRAAVLGSELAWF